LKKVDVSRGKMQRKLKRKSDDVRENPQALQPRKSKI